MKKKLDKSVTCSKCDNFAFCIAKQAADEFAKKVMGTGLFRGGEDSIGTLESYMLLANNCRKFDNIND
jgi:hypothetical protein